MKKITNGFLIILAVYMAFSCTKIDNYDGPNAAFKGNIIDKTTGKNLLTETSGVQIKLEELSWSNTPTPQYIPSKQDGTFQDTKLFSGHYRVTPTNGPFWPGDTAELDINGTTSHDFQLTPYLKIVNVTHTMSGTTLTIKFHLEAPITNGLPNVLDVKPFVNTTEFVGSGATISQYSESNKKDINASWSDAIANTEYTLKVANLKEERTFYVRVGARVDDSFKKYNYSDTFKIVVPKADPNAIPDNYLKNADYPFTKASWDGNRWGNLTDWLTNDAIRSKGGYGGYDGGYGATANDQLKSFGIERWNADENTILNGKIYQSVTLPAGTYEYKLSFKGDNPDATNGGSDPRYIVAAIGSSLPDIADINNSLGSATLVGVNGDHNSGGAVTVSFSLTQPTQVSVGLVINWTNTQQNIRVSNFSLKKVD